MTSAIRTALLTVLMFEATGFATDRAVDTPPLPKVVAHRGLLLDAPENTLANFSACLKLNLGFEVDVQRSKDGELVCVHDSTVDRTTNGKGKVSELTLAQLKELDAGSWFGESFAGQQIPTLREVFKRISEHRGGDVLIAIDFKSERRDRKIEADVVRLAEKHGILDHLLMIGAPISDPQMRKRLRQASAHAHIAAVANNLDELTYVINDKYADWIYVRFVPTEAEIGSIHATGRKAFIAGKTVSGRETENW
ncbi:MAG: hypothetical protein H8E37_07290, partial [Planctomycetes bacterium]|nr:hypothetical protein [Planctomycetota bacterium]